MVTPRCYNTAEALQYLGVKRRFFETQLQPRLSGKGIKCGTSIVYEIKDLDAAWESYKIAAGGERPEVEEGASSWDEPKRPASKARKPAMTLTRSTKLYDFASAASKVLKQPKAG
ncbi:hypothetical protein GCM10008066_03710 [Oxalicibacterium faecigallinarum]|uniref:Uncharacterized protein n=1 Tax=Oxalicibacterium faecigallinarum TaxID=573741 RepID=A0A8J3AMD1_9BURK|nr:hypothetical protein GCM10008066_03710 [Oxalicibacterium faecigallinarum]